MGSGWFGGIFFGQYSQGGTVPPAIPVVISTQNLDGSYMLLVGFDGEYALQLDVRGVYRPDPDIPGEVES